MPTSVPPMKVAVMGVKTLQKNKGAEHEIAMLSLALLKEPFQVDSPGDLSNLQDKFKRWGIVRRGGGSSSLKMDAKSMNKGGRGKDDEVIIGENEGMMVREFLKKIAEEDPDVIVQHNAFAFGLDILASRINFCRVEGWDVVKRITNSSQFKFKKFKYFIHCILLVIFS